MRAYKGGTVGQAARGGHPLESYAMTSQYERIVMLLDLKNAHMHVCQVSMCTPAAVQLEGV